MTDEEKQQNQTKQAHERPDAAPPHTTHAPNEESRDKDLDWRDTRTDEDDNK